MNRSHSRWIAPTEVPTRCARNAALIPAAFGDVRVIEAGVGIFLQPSGVLVLFVPVGIAMSTELRVPLAHEEPVRLASPNLSYKANRKHLMHPLSASALDGFLGCAHQGALQLAGVKPEGAADPMLEFVREKGCAHEGDVLSRLEVEEILTSDAFSARARSRSRLMQMLPARTHSPPVGSRTPLALLAPEGQLGRPRRRDPHQTIRALRPPTHSPWSSPLRQPQRNFRTMSSARGCV